MVSPTNGEVVADPKVRDRLMSAALDLFVNKGYATTRVREIVEAAGVTKPALYYYFKNKEGLYLELIQQAYRQFETMIEDEGAEKGSCRERISDLFGRILVFFKAKGIPRGLCRGIVKFERSSRK